MKLSEYTGLKAPHILLWGEVGTGKTAFAETLGERCELLDLDNGSGTGLGLKDKYYAARCAVEVKKFPEPQPHIRATQFDAVKRYVIDVANRISAKKYPYDALVIDSLSTLSDAAVRQIMYNSGKIGGTPEIQHWGMAFNEVKNLLAIVNSLEIVTVLVAHEQVKSTGSGATKKDSLEIATPGKNLPSQICRYYDEIWYLDVAPAGGNKVKYTLKTLGDGTIPARSRLGLPTNTDITSVGLWELLATLGYKPPLREKPPVT